MVTFKDSCAKLLADSADILATVAEKAGAMKDDDAFNVSEFAKQYAKKLGLPEKEENSVATFVASMIRVAAMNSDEYANKRGRYGGMKRVKATAAAPTVTVTSVVSNIVSDSDEAEVPEEVETVSENELPAGMDVLAEALSVDDDTTEVAV